MNWIKHIWLKSKRIIITIFIVLFLITAPFWGSMIHNEIRLIIFDSQLNKLEQIFDKYDATYQLMAKGRSTYIGGNCDCISFRSVRVYRIFTKEVSNLLQEIKDYRFNNAIKTETLSKYSSYPEVYAYFNSFTLTIIVEDGAYDAWLDLRYW